MSVSWSRKNASVYDGLIGSTAMSNCFTYIFSMLLRSSIWRWVVEEVLSSFAELESVEKNIICDIVVCSLLVMIVPKISLILAGEVR
jgi:hypothetical protein